jgi:uncharacterized protein (DUF488 family)
MDIQNNSSNQRIIIFTIGFTQKSAREFFELLQRAGAHRVIDIRLNNESQLAGFTKKEDLEYFLKAIAGIDYVHRPNLAPTKEILDSYKKKKLSWADYERQFLKLMTERRVESTINHNDLDKACLLCSEPNAERCHRKLVAEYLRAKWGNVEISHL